MGQLNVLYGISCVYVLPVFFNGSLVCTVLQHWTGLAELLSSVHVGVNITHPLDTFSLLKRPYVLASLRVSYERIKS